MTTFIDDLSAALLAAITYKFNENHDELGRFASGDSSGSSGSDPYASAVEQIAQHNIEANNAVEYARTHVQIGNKVSAYRHPPGMGGENKPKQWFKGEVVNTDTDEKGNQTFRMEYLNNKNVTKSLWVNTVTDKWKKE